MLDRSISLASLIDPVTPEAFLDDVFDKKPLLVPGDAGKFDDVITWDGLNEMLNMTNVWSSHNMRLVLNGDVLPAEEYCVNRMGRDSEKIMRPVFPRMENFLEKGATLNLNFVEMLHPGVASAATSLAMRFAAPFECNVYSSWKGVQAFNPHFDVMDVFVLHIAGEKRWRIYENRFDAPAEAVGYRHTTLSDEFNESFRGDVAMEPLLTPGDFLYIPKGYYHDALASSEACMHLTFGLMEQRGEDLIRHIVDQLSDDRLFRLTMPHPDDQAGFEQRLRDLGTRFGEIMATDQTSSYFRRRQTFETFRMMPGFAFPSPQYDQVFRRRRQAMDGLNFSGDEQPLVDWVEAGDYFEIEELVATFADAGMDIVMGLIDKLVEAGIIEPAFPEHEDAAG